MVWSTSTRRARLPKDWPKIRLAVLQRDGWACQIRGPRCLRWANQADHIVAGDDHRPANLQAACGPCHRAKSSHEGGIAAGLRRRRRAEPHPGLR